MTQTHDLLQLNPDPSLLSFRSEAEESAVRDPHQTPGNRTLALNTLTQLPWAVVRRAPTQAGRIPIGIRGPARHQRYPAWLDPRAILRILPPPSLLQLPIPRDLPVFQAFQTLKTLWSSLPNPWGPTGSVAFELATGNPTANLTSDLDLILYATQPLTPSQLRFLATTTDSLPIQVDLQIQTPHGIFLLADHLRTPHSVLLRTLTGSHLTPNPWTPV